MKPFSEYEFVWDEAKAQSNERKHGITFKLAAAVFRDKLAGVRHDVSHDGFEDRWVVVGTVAGEMLVVVICTFAEMRDNDRVRIISARRATLRERREYESGEFTIREPVMTDQYPEHSPAVDDDPDMEAEYDFSNAVRGKFAHWRLPVYIENSILGYFHDRSIATGIPGDTLINEVLRQHVAAAGYVPPVFKEGR